MKKISLLFILLLFFVGSEKPVLAATGSTYYVSTSGNDSNSGTESAPWRTVQKAANTVVAGDIVLVEPGTYYTNPITDPQVQVTTSGTVGKPILYQAQGNVEMTGFNVKADYISIKGFTITTLADNGVGINITQGGFCDIENNLVRYSTWGGINLWALPANPTAVHDCTVKNNTLYRNGQYGLQIMGQNNLVEGNDISQTIQHHPCEITYATVSWLDADGIRFHGGGHLFRGNKIHDIYYGPVGYAQGTSCSLANVANLANDFNDNPHIDCFQTYAGDKVVGHDTVFDANYCNNPDHLADFSLAGKVFQVEGGAFNLTMKNNVSITNLVAIINGGHDLSFLNNTFYGNPNNLYSQGIQLINGAYNMAIKNNIFAYQQDGISSIHTDASSKTGLDAGYNCVYKSGGTPARQADPGDVWNQNPMFVNETGDLHLQASSPCIDRGLSVGVATDYDGIPRPQEAGFDIGAFEFQGGSSPVGAGDANSDGLINALDIRTVISNYLKAATAGLDQYSDLKVNVFDFVTVLKRLP